NLLHVCRCRKVLQRHRHIDLEIVYSNPVTGTGNHPEVSPEKIQAEVGGVAVWKSALGERDPGLAGPIPAHERPALNVKRVCSEVSPGDECGRNMRQPG